jgi:hypothetical protein
MHALRAAAKGRWLQTTGFTPTRLRKAKLKCSTSRGDLIAPRLSLGGSSLDKWRNIAAHYGF